MSRLRIYASDFWDAINWQCLTAVFFVFFTCFFPAMTFGSILSECSLSTNVCAQKHADKNTHGVMGVKESLFATGIIGLIFACFAAQPLMLLGVTGPMLIYEESLYTVSGSCAFTSNALFLIVRTR